MRLIIEDIRHLKLKEMLLWLGTTTLVTVVIWIGYSIYTAYHKSQIDPQVSAYLQPLNPQLDTEAIAMLGDVVNIPVEFSVQSSVPVASRSASH